MEPLWAPEQHTLAFRSNAPTSAHPGQTKSLCAASPLPPRPAPSTDVDPLPPPGGGGCGSAATWLRRAGRGSGEGPGRPAPSAATCGDTGLSRAASPCGSDGTAGPGMVPAVPSRAQRRGVPASRRQPRARSSTRGTAPAQGLARTWHGGDEGGDSAAMPSVRRHRSPDASARIGRRANGAEQTAPRVALPAPDDPGSPPPTPPRYPPRRGDGRRSQSRTPPSAASGAAPWTLYRLGRRPPLPNRPAAPSQRRRCAPLPSPCPGSPHRPTAPSHPVVPSVSRALPGRSRAAPRTPTEQLRGVVGRSRRPNLMGKSAEGKNKQPLSTINRAAAAPRSRRGDGTRRWGRRGAGVGATRGCGARDGAEGGEGRPSPIRS